MQLLQPNEIVDVKGPVIFLAGPIQGAPEWQEEAMNYLKKLDDKLIIASPRRTYAKGEYVFEKQVDWESYYLKKSSKKGVILFWLAKEVEHKCDRAYAQTTRFELAEWKDRTKKIVIGIEDGFPGAKYIIRRLNQDCPKIKIRNNLEDTCKDAYNLIKRG